MDNTKLGASIEIPETVEELSQEQLKNVEKFFLGDFYEGLKKYRTNKLAKDKAFRKKVAKRRNKKKLNKKFKK